MTRVETGWGWTVLAAGAVACGGVAVDRSVPAGVGGGAQAAPGDSTPSSGASNARPGSASGSGQSTASAGTGGVADTSAPRTTGQPAYGVGGAVASGYGGAPENPGGAGGGMFRSDAHGGADFGGSYGEAGFATFADAGASNESDCSSEPVGSLSGWQARQPNVNLTVNAQLAQARSTLAGNWHGIVTTPWVAPYSVAVSFAPAGGYAARCIHNSDYASGTGCCRAFYYGTDRDTPLKQWSLSAVDEAGPVSGSIDIVFDYGDSGFGLPSWQGLITGLDYDATGNRLRFDFSTSDGYGPVSFDLQRD